MHNHHILPKNLKQEFKFSRDLKSGDYYKYHLYCYYKNLTDSGSQSEKWHHSWTISGTQYDTSPSPEALEAQRQDEEAEKFLRKIRDQLIAEGCRLMMMEEGLIKVREGV